MKEKTETMRETYYVIRNRKHKVAIKPRVVSSIFQIAQILVQSHFKLVSSVQVLEATEPVSEPVTQMAVELINNHLISVQQKR